MILSYALKVYNKVYLDLHTPVLERRIKQKDITAVTGAVYFLVKHKGKAKSKIIFSDNIHIKQ